MTTSPFAALGSRNFRLIWLGLSGSFVGGYMQTATVLWHVSLLSPPGRHRRPGRVGGAGCLAAAGAITYFTPSLWRYSALRPTAAVSSGK